MSIQGITGRRLTLKSMLLGASAAAIAAIVPASANAADLGGDCCADLEERIAELEATTARKGNRKVSLEIYGQVNEGILFWDDGAESNVGIYTNDNSRTRFGFKGKAKITPDWEAGYAIEIGVRAANSKRFDQFNDDGADTGFDLRDSFWYLKSKTYGAVSLGQQATSTDAITELNLSQTSSFSKYSDLEDTGGGLILRSSVNGNLTGSGLTLRRLIGDGGDQPGEGERRYNVIKYDTPTFAGFSLSASWGEDDFWDAAIRYKGEFNGIKIVAGFGYGEITDGPETQTQCNGSVPVANIPAPVPPAPALNLDQSCSQYGGSVSVLHEPTGLFVNFGAGVKNDDLIGQTARFVNTGVDDEQTFYAIQAGLERKFNDLGKTTIYGEYYDYEGGGNSRRTLAVGDALNPFGANSAAVWSTGVQSYGAGIAQGLDKAATVLYLSYRHVEGELEARAINLGNANGAIAVAPIEDVDLLFGGAIIKF